MTLPRVLFVTGKGGTGKSTVAAALALARSRRRPTTLADLDRRGCAAAMLGVTSVDGTAAKVTKSLEVIALGARAELDSFIARIVPIRAISRRMLRSRTFGYVTAALPGLDRRFGCRFSRRPDPLRSDNHGDARGARAARGA